MQQDLDIVTVEPLGNRPQQLYFFPVITFIILFYFNRVGVVVPDGYVSALLGVSVLSVMVMTACVAFGIITDEYYNIRTRAQGISGEIFIGALSLFSTQLTFYVIGFYDNWYPTTDIILWFIYGWIAYQIMWQIFKYFYNQRPFGQINRANILTGLIVTIIAGIIPIYIAGFYGWV